MATLSTRCAVRLQTSLFLFAAGLVAGLALVRKSQRPADDAGPDGLDYLREAAAADLFQVEAGKLARKRSQDPAVQRFAEKMIKHHQRALLHMRRAARMGGFDIDQLPGLTPQYHDLMAALRSARDHLFDSVYLRTQVQVHEAGLDLHDGVDVDPLTDAADDAAAMMAEHLAEAEALLGRRPQEETADAAADDDAGVPPAKPRGMPQTPNQTPGDGGAAPAFD